MGGFNDKTAQVGLRRGRVGVPAHHRAAPLQRRLMLLRRLRDRVGRCEGSVMITELEDCVVCGESYHRATGTIS